MFKYTEVKLVHGELVAVTFYPLQRLENHLNPAFSKTRGNGGRVAQRKGRE